MTGAPSDIHDQANAIAGELPPVQASPQPGTPALVRAPLWSTLLLTWVNNIGASASLMGVYFVAHEAYGFKDSKELGLGVVQGVTYIAGSLTAGWGARVLGSGSGGKPGLLGSTRTLLACVLLLMSAVAWAPILWRSEGAIWLLMVVYSPLSGWLWPLVESYLASGRSGAELRRTTGGFNFAWSSCQVLTFWAMSAFMPPVEAGAVATPQQVTQALWIIPLLSLSNVASLLLFSTLPRRPAAHDDHADPALTPLMREHYQRLLVASRCMIVLSYLSYSAMNPLLPRILEGFHLSASQKPLATSTWMLLRVGMFGLMGWWHGWQGRRLTLAWSAGILFTGFAMVLLAPNLPILLVGLALFGVGHGSVYSAAFYYAMEVGSAGVDAGGKHEAVIGLGYTAGPLAALGAEFAASHVLGAGDGAPHQGSVVLVVSLFALAAAGFAWRAVRPRAVRLPSSR